MSLVLAAGIGYLLGSVPTANLLARLRGIDLRAEGSTNPGANNARRLGGVGLASAVLIAESVKGAVAVLIGNALSDDVGMVVAGVAAVIGNVYNIWYRFRGGKGLGISLGVLAVGLPATVPIALVSIAALAWLTRSSGKAALGALAVLVLVAFLGPESWIPTPWGIDEIRLIPWLILGMSLVIAPKHVGDARSAG